MLAFIGVAASLIVAEPGRADAVNVNGNVFSDDFTGSTLDTAKWTSGASNGGSVTVDGTSVLMNTSDGTSGTAYIENTSALNFGSSPNDWGVEVKFQVRPSWNWWSLNNTELPASDLNKQFSILTGTTAIGDYTAQGFDLRAMRWNGSNWYLGWYGTDDTGIRVCAELTAGMPLGTTEHTVALHRTSDGNVAIYLDNNLLSTQPLIGGSNPVGLIAGDVFSGYVAGMVSVDSVKIGAVPEPSTLALLATGLTGLLAYAWRKRR